MRNGQAWIVIDNVQILSSMECWLQCILDGLPLLFMFASVSMPFIVTCYHWLALLDISGYLRDYLMDITYISQQSLFV